jgi:Ca2+-binding RTX toxin-like protein
VSADTDMSVDVYERSAGQATLVSTGSPGNGAFDAEFVGASADGSRVFFQMIGLAGDHCLSGHAGKDRLSGGVGNDTLTGGKGRDKVNAGTGNDKVNSRDKRRETVRCGKGKRDRVTADRSDRLIGCDNVRRV